MEQIVFKDAIYQPVSTIEPQIKSIDEVVQEEVEAPQLIQKGSCLDFLNYCSRCANCCTQWCLCFRLCKDNID